VYTEFIIDQTPQASVTESSVKLPPVGREMHMSIRAHLD
jgi:hypothetical protein